MTRFNSSKSILILTLSIFATTSHVVTATPPAWFSQIQEEFTNSSFPLRSCRKRGNQVPPDGGSCGARAKTCFFGDQVCESDGTGESFPYPTENCACTGSLAVRNPMTWSCQTVACPGTTDGDTNTTKKGVSIGGCTPSEEGFDMCVKVHPDIPTQDLPVLQAAREKWNSVIIGDSPDFLYDADVFNTTGFSLSKRPPANASGLAAFYEDMCGFDPEFSVETIDDINICIDLVDFGESGIVSLAGPAFGDNFTRFGVIALNEEELSRPRIGNSIFENYISISIGRILGIGILWASTSLGNGMSVNSTDCTYIGENANRVYQELSGCPADVSLPIMPPFSGFCGQFLQFQCFREELMTQVVSSPLGVKPLSVITAALLDDLGYSVDYSKTDNYTRSDLGGSCVCDSTGRKLTDESTENLLEELFSTITDERRRLSEERRDTAVAFTKEKLKEMNMMANSAGTHAIIPGLSVVYRDGDTLHTMNVMSNGEVIDDEEV